jgi:preprotein translocase subunit YajC
MNETHDLTTLTVRIAIFVVIALIFFFVLRGKKKEK